MSCPVERQLTAYNARDIDAFCEAFSQNIRVFNYPNELVLEGMAAYRGRYAEYFQSHPDLHCELISRIRIGNRVTDEERVTRIAGEPTIHAIAIYEIEDERIREIRFIK